MKNNIKIIILCTIIFTLSAFSENEFEIIKTVDCDQVAKDTVAILEAYSPCEYSDAELIQIQNNAFWDCLGSQYNGDFDKVDAKF